jgi:hypothetical protein
MTTPGHAWRDATTQRVCLGNVATQSGDSIAWEGDGQTRSCLTDGAHRLALRLQDRAPHGQGRGCPFDPIAIPSRNPIAMGSQFDPFSESDWPAGCAESAERGLSGT